MTPDGWVGLEDIDPSVDLPPEDDDLAASDIDLDDEWEPQSSDIDAIAAEAAAHFGFDVSQFVAEDGTVGLSGQLPAPGAANLAVVAVIGRPNVGKSTLVNRIIGRREAVVQDVPGVTRDRVTYEAEWSGREFLLVDTGGWESDATGFAGQIAAQAEIAISQADAVILVVDAMVGTTDSDEAVIRVIRRAGKPVILAANKVDDARGEADAAALWSLGIGEPQAVSAMHGRGFGDMLDALLAVLPEHGSGQARPQGPRRVAILGKPNVGKSSLLNKLAGQTRAVVSEIAGTTVDPVDEVVELRGREWLFVDTAGIRRRIREASGHEYYASLRTHAALERAEVAVVLLDGGEPLSEQDLRITSMVVESGRALVVVVNKWDLVDEERRRYLERELETDLAPVAWAPRVNVSARTGRAMDKLVPALDAALAGWETRVSTGRLNAFLKELVAAHPHPLRGGKQPRILFGTQASAKPPTFVLFTTGFLEAGYRRFVERRLREEFGFVGTPIQINLRIRQKRANRS
jgi:GTP-binding protein